MNDQELKIVIKATIDEFQKSMKQAKEDVEEFGKESDKSMDAFDKAVDGAKETAKTAFKAIGVAITGAVTSMTALAESTREYRTNQAKLTTTFEQAGASADDAAKTYKSLYRVLGDDGQATEAAAHLAQLTNNQEDLADWTEICQGVYATFGDSLPIESLTEAANETAKTGELTGALADALNWAGISEDEFQASLEECNDEASREKKIRETLNKVYSKTAKEYEKTAKKTLDANDAQAKLNDSMAKIGDTVEPVVTEFKNLGAALMDKVAPYVEDVAEFITDDLIPAIKDVVNWVKDNKDMLIGVVAGLTTGIVAYKAAVLLAKAAEEGITVATLARAAAQKALNLAMAATPAGLVAAGVAALVTGLVAYSFASDDAAKKVDVLSEAERALIEEARETAEAFREQQTATADNMATIQAEAQHTRDLAAELDNLVGANGRVQEADQARVDFILGALNEALGTEYEMVNGVVLEYDKLEKEIYEVINAKTANAMLEAYNADYIAAIQGETEALGAVLAAEKDYHAQKQDTQAAKEAYLAYNEELLQREKDAILGFGVEVSESEWIRLNEMKMAYDEEQGLLDEKKTAYDNAAADYGNYQNTINKYEDAALLIQKGNHTEAINLLKTKGKAYFDYADDVDVATQEAIDALFEEAVKAGIEAERTKTNFENGVEGYTDEMVKEAETGYADALKEWEDAYNDANGVGGDLGDGLKDGLTNKEGGLLSKARSIVGNIIAAMKQEADSHSPSKKTMAFGNDLGAGAEIGLEQSTKDVVKAAKDMASKTLIPLQASFDGYTMKNFGDIGFNTKAMFTGSMPSLEVNSHWADVLVQKLNENQSDTPIILQVDGKTFAEISVDTLNSLTKQRGYLPLLLG